MITTAALFSLVLTLAILTVALILIAKRRRNLVTARQAEASARPTAIEFGTNPASPAVTVRPVPSSAEHYLAESREFKASSGVASRLTSLMQAAPSLLVAEAHRGRQLMEVVIDGRLIRAADGDGFRAITRVGDRIQDHARLYDTKDLSKLVNAAAVWQLASVVVAQKHMADINQKLTDIKEAVDNITNFLDSERRGVIRGTYQYLLQAQESLAKGELSPAIRGELESCERDLLSVQTHLVAEIERQTRERLRDEDTFGTESLWRNGVAKYMNLGRAADDLKLCLETRALSWYVLSLYPGEPGLKAVRCDSILQGLSELERIESIIETESRSNVQSFKSFWNFDSTLDERKGQVLQEAQKVKARLQSSRTATAAELTQTQTLLLKRDQPTRLIVELVDGTVSQVREREMIAA